jgi:hypothetical protein
MKVLFDSEQAAQHTQVDGWVSRHGVFFGYGQFAEQDARQHGCTHRSCPRCGAEMLKHRAVCLDCDNKMVDERYAKMPKRAPEPGEIIYSETKEKNYESVADAEEDLEDGETIDGLHLVICEPEYCRELREDEFCDNLPDDTDLDERVVAAIAQFNKAVAGIILSWMPGKYAVDLGEEVKNETI